jgi:hypothetical protein
MFSKPDAHVLEAFAGSCPSLFGAMTLSRDISLVEKHKPFSHLFEQHFNNVEREIENTSGGGGTGGTGGIPTSSSKRKATGTKSDESEELDGEEETDAEGSEGSDGKDPKKKTPSVKISF